MDLEEPGLAAALRDEQHDRRIHSVGVHPRQDLRVDRLFKLVLGRHDKAARRHELPGADRFRHEVLELFASEIIHPDLRLPPQSDAGR